MFTSAKCIVSIFIGHRFVLRLTLAVYICLLFPAVVCCLAFSLASHCHTRYTHTDWFSFFPLVSVAFKLASVVKENNNKKKQFLAYLAILCSTCL